jgi:hypothetical protein
VHAYRIVRIVGLTGGRSGQGDRKSGDREQFQAHRSVLVVAGGSSQLPELVNITAGATAMQIITGKRRADAQALQRDEIRLNRHGA